MFDVILRTYTMLLCVTIIVYIILPYIANRLRYKSFAVAELNFSLLENIHGWMVVLHGKAYCTGYLTGKVLRHRSICENRETFPP